MFDGRSLDDAERMIQDWQAGIEAQAAQARELSSRLAALAVTVRSGDEFVEVTVGSSGDVIRLELAEGIRGQCGTGRGQCGTGRGQCGTGRGQCGTGRGQCGTGRGQCGTGRAQCGTGRAGSAADPRRTENCVCWFPCCSALCAIIGSRGLDRWVDGTSAAVGGLRECVNRRRPHLAVAA